MHNQKNISETVLFSYTKRRTLAEQWVGLFLFCLLSFCFFLIDGWTFHKSLGISLMAKTKLLSWLLQGSLNLVVWFVYHQLLALSMWTLWRRISLLNLKLELTLFLIQLAFLSLFFLCLFRFQETLLSLFVNLFLVSNTILSIFLFRKKKKTSGVLLIPGFVWIFYVMIATMALNLFQ